MQENDPTAAFVRELPAYATLRCEHPAPHVLRVVLNRPAAANALDTQMGADLLDLWTRLTAAPLAAALVLAAAATLQLLPVDPVMRRVAVGAVAAVCLMAAMVFFLFAVKDRD